ncbi:MAG TPA: hypothetical protein VNN72_06870, partial [Polyangiaceae bacterium]|nr:hypothetical protein [Polyangiaceae bacterium]
ALLAKRLFPPYERSFGARMIRMVSERWADARAFFRPLLARLVPQARAAFERLVAWLDARRAMLPKPAAERLAKVPSRAIAGIILGFAGLVVLLALVGIVGAIVGSASPRPPAEVKTASSSEASAPVPSAGPSASSAAAAPAPSGAPSRDPALEGLLAKANERANAKDFAGSVAAASQALALDPTAASDPRLASALFQAAQDKKSPEAAFKLLEGPMGERGAGIVHDLAVFAPKGSPAQTRAETWLGSPRFTAVAPPALRLAVAMRRARSCDEVRALLPEVKLGGDKQSLPYLKFFKEHLGKYPCLKKDTLLDDTMRTVSARAAKL